ncbi:hypothetical protein ACEQ6A_07135 [Rhizobium brockwellii]|uniref:hypothetical protein n=1 Tax=Rhizobium brockwellii TaxID=3019932 RepID=UPI003F9A7E44
MAKADGVCEKYSGDRVGLNVRLLDDDGDKNIVLIEGQATALRFLAELLLAVADGEPGETFYISPFSAGRMHFSKDSELGFYLHRTT